MFNIKKKAEAQKPTSMLSEIIVRFEEGHVSVEGHNISPNDSKKACLAILQTIKDKFPSVFHILAMEVFTTTGDMLFEP